MVEKYDVSKKLKDILSYNEETRLAVLRAYIIDGKSHRQIQSEILELPAPLHGGGYVAMNILHYYGVSGDEKGILRNKTISELQDISSEELKEALLKLGEYAEYEQSVKEQIQKKDFEFHDKETEISTETKVRINQNILRNIVLDNYRNECALCEIKSKDLLVCSHIVPWRVDEKNRLNPGNAICLCVLHDRLFDRGYFSLDRENSILIADKCDLHLRSLLTKLKFKKPNADSPHSSFLEFHRNEIFDK